MTTVEEQLRAFIVENYLLGDGEALDASESLFDSGVLDSTGVIELVGFLEGQFGIKIANKDLVPENLGSIERIVAFVASKLEGVVSGDSTAA